MNTVWMLTDPDSGDVAYVRIGLDEDTENTQVIGPFAYSTSEAAAEAALAENPAAYVLPWIPRPAAILEVEATSFVQALFNGFPPSATDVFVLDDGFFPISPAGAAWVDKALGRPHWSPLFDEEHGTGLTWLNRVLFQVGDRIGLDLKAMQAIGEMVVAEGEDDVANEVEQAKRLVQEHVKVAIIPELTEQSREQLLPVNTTFWLHTKGLTKLGLPELEIRGVPAWWVTAAGAELNAWAAYSTQHPIQDGQSLHGGGPIPVLIRAVKSATCAGAVAVQGQSAEHSGTSTAGTTSQITLQNTASAVDQAYRGMILRTTGGTGPNQIVEVLDYIGATKVAIVGPAFAVAPDTDTTYTVCKGFFLEKSPNEILDIYRPCAQAYSALPGGAAKKYYEKFFWWNNHASLALTESTISEDSDPDAVWAFALEAALDGVTTNGGGNNRQVAPAGTFNSTAKNVANSQSLTAQTAQPGWLELSVAEDLAALKTSCRLKLSGKTV